MKLSIFITTFFLSFFSFAETKTFKFPSIDLRGKTVDGTLIDTNAKIVYRVSCTAPASVWDKLNNGLDKTRSCDLDKAMSTPGFDTINSLPVSNGQLPAGVLVVNESKPTVCIKLQIPLVSTSPKGYRRGYFSICNSVAGTSNQPWENGVLIYQPLSELSYWKNKTELLY